ncbi:MAG: SRPBCC family protein [Acidimicrobiales bacterium]
MPSVHVSEHSDLPPEVVLAAARDFSPRRARMWPDVHVVHLEVHEFGEGYAEVTEGNPWPIGYVWERLRYDWSEPHALRGTVIASNLFKPGSTWELWATPEDGESRVEIRAVRHLRGRGLLLAPFFPLGAAAASVRDHLRHFLSSIDPRTSTSIDEA